MLTVTDKPNLIVPADKQDYTGPNLEQLPRDLADKIRAVVKKLPKEAWRLECSEHPNLERSALEFGGMNNESFRVIGNICVGYSYRESYFAETQHYISFVPRKPTAHLEELDATSKALGFDPTQDRHIRGPLQAESYWNFDRGRNSTVKFYYVESGGATFDAMGRS